MASLPLFSMGAAAGGRVFTARAAKGAAGSTEEKSFLDWVLGNLTKEDQFYETDPILQKVEGKAGTTSGRNGGTVSVPAKKKNSGGGGGGGAFGGLFAKK